MEDKGRGEGQNAGTRQTEQKRRKKEQNKGQNTGTHVGGGWKRRGGREVLKRWTDEREDKEGRTEVQKLRKDGWKRD